MEILKSEKTIKDLKKRIKTQKKNFKPNIVVLCGGRSFEHDISILTAQTIANAVNKYNVHILYQSLEGDFYLVPFDNVLKNYKLGIELLKVNLIANNNVLYDSNYKKLFKIDLVINCTHGQNCEDGTLTHLLNLCNVPSTNANATCQAITLDKEYMKDIICANSILTPRYWVLKEGEEINKYVDKINYPLIVKPANLGSSIGICICHNEKELNKGVELARQFDKKIIIEEFIEDVVEVNCACIKVNDEFIVSKCEIPNKKHEFLSFDDKYLNNAKGKKGQGGNKTNTSILDRTTFCHSANGEIVEDSTPIDKIDKLNELDDDTVAKVRQMTKDLYQIFDCDGVVRIDYLVKDDKVYVNELNSIPGSLAYYLFDANIEEYVEMLILSAYKNYKSRQNKKYYFDTHIFS